MHTLTPAWEIHFQLVYTLNSSLVYCAMPGVNPIMGNGTHEKGLKDEGLGFGFTQKNFFDEISCSVLQNSVVPLRLQPNTNTLFKCITQHPS